MPGKNSLKNCYPLRDMENAGDAIGLMLPDTLTATEWMKILHIQKHTVTEITSLNPSTKTSHLINS